ncbi:MAG: shikimate kinase [Bacteroidota bacterium]
MRIYLIGYMASGKSYLGKLLAEKLGYLFLDIDHLFEKRFRISVLDFFMKYDEDSFRKIERSLLHETLDHDDVVISTGGGTPCFFDNMRFINKGGISIYLHCEIPTLVNRLLHVKRKRPLLKDITAAELEEKVKLQLEERAFYYNQANYTIDMENLDINIILEWIRNRSGIS